MTGFRKHGSLPVFDTVVRGAAHGLIRGYQLGLSGLVGRHCRHWPSCSEYTDQAIQRHGLWAGGWIGAARICRCGPWGTSGIDLVCEEVSPTATPLTPWRYGRWRGVNGPADDPASGSQAKAPVKPEHANHKPFQLKE